MPIHSEKYSVRPNNISIVLPVKSSAQIGEMNTNIDCIFENSSNSFWIGKVFQKLLLLTSDALKHSATYKFKSITEMHISEIQDGMTGLTTCYRRFLLGRQYFNAVWTSVHCPCIEWVIMRTGSGKFISFNDTIMNNSITTYRI